MLEAIYLRVTFVATMNSGDHNLHYLHTPLKPANTSNAWHTSKVVLMRAEAVYEKGEALLWNFAETAAMKGWICDGILCRSCCWGLKDLEEASMKWYTRVSVPQSPYMIFLMHSLAIQIIGEDHNNHNRGGKWGQPMNQQ
jgi:hypothetical protein